MQCPKCNTPNTADAVFCRECGAPIAAATGSPAAPAALSTPADKKKIIALIILSACTLIVVLSTLLIYFQSSAREDRQFQKQLSMGDKYLSDLDYEAAVLAYEAAIEIDPNNPAPYIRLADAYLEQGDYDMAADVLEQGELAGVDNTLLVTKKDEVISAKNKKKPAGSKTDTDPKETSAPESKTPQPETEPQTETETAEPVFADLNVKGAAITANDEYIVYPDGEVKHPQDYSTYNLHMDARKANGSDILATDASYDCEIILLENDLFYTFADYTTTTRERHRIKHRNLETQQEYIYGNSFTHSPVLYDNALYFLEHGVDLHRLDLSDQTDTLIYTLENDTIGFYIEEDWIYFTFREYDEKDADEFGGLHRVSIDGSKKEHLLKDKWIGITDANDGIIYYIADASIYAYDSQKDEKKEIIHLESPINNHFVYDKMHYIETLDQIVRVDENQTITALVSDAALLNVMDDTLYYRPLNGDLETLDLKNLVLPDPPAEETSAPEPASTLTEDEAIALLRSILGSTNEETGFNYGFGCQEIISVNGIATYAIRTSWLVEVDGTPSHSSYLGHFFVSLDGSIIYQGFTYGGEPYEIDDTPYWTAP